MRILKYDKFYLIISYKFNALNKFIKYNKSIKNNDIYFSIFFIYNLFKRGLIHIIIFDH